MPGQTIAFLEGKDVLLPTFASRWQASARDNSSVYQNLQGLLNAKSIPAVLLSLSQRAKFSPTDVPSRVDLRGLIIFCCCDYGAGTSTVGNRRSIRGRNSVAQLPKRLLGKRNGAIAFIGHVFGASMRYSDLKSKEERLFYTFESAIKSIISGQPVGGALTCFSRAYAELAMNLHSLSEVAEILRSRNLRNKISLMRKMVDATKYILIGDPAARPRLKEIGSLYT
jgi:hypothetical protein